jgi:hypothetical protein
MHGNQNFKTFQHGYKVRHAIIIVFDDNPIFIGLIVLVNAYRTLFLESFRS